MSEKCASLVSEHKEIQDVVLELREKFGDDEEAPTNPTILAEAYQMLAVACRRAGEIEEADKYDKRVKMLKQKIKRF